MPDHLHGILFVEQAMQEHLGAIIRGFKTSTNKAYRQLVLGQEAEAAAPPPHSQQAAPAAAFSALAASPSAPAASPSAPALSVGCAAAVPQHKPPPSPPPTRTSSTSAASVSRTLSAPASATPARKST
jgi:hypothetical protein